MVTIFRTFFVTLSQKHHIISFIFDKSKFYFVHNIIERQVHTTLVIYSVLLIWWTLKLNLKVRFCYVEILSRSYASYYYIILHIIHITRRPLSSRHAPTVTVNIKHVRLGTSSCIDIGHHQYQRHIP